MDNVKDDLYYVSKIKTDLLFIIEHTKGMTKEDLKRIRGLHILEL